ncbi:MAG: hypothetical protein BECKG1743D_GA0114223_106805 [Candidatus Kentron sp. G]|nr:MAG: hypothetical protein BECKG1743F_GA0114225_105292 [Candidatus Kentron sp. G]VFN03218.1 MAG: hypothetical protein BECKG1743E_GA0114224_105913 [Candidatus Kentron sp. G]VFN05167.1 MAG: hypothetical protein BECKG1743D_GA0114223_106805 [Candidatus Kentron sp. G]
MIKPHIYTDTSVIGGCLDKEFQAGPEAFFERFESGSVIMMLSDLILSELENAPPCVRDRLRSCLEIRIGAPPRYDANFQTAS